MFKYFTFFIILLTFIMQSKNEQINYKKTYPILSNYYNNNYSNYINKLHYYEYNFYDNANDKFLSHLIWKLPTQRSKICIYTLEEFNVFINKTPLSEIDYLIYQKKVSTDCSIIGLDQNDWYGYISCYNIKALFANNMYPSQSINEKSKYKLILPKRNYYNKIYNKFIDSKNNSTTCQYIYDKC